MKKRTFENYFKLGGRLAYSRISAIGANPPYGGKNHIKVALENAFEVIDELDLKVTKNVSIDLQEFKRELDEKIISIPPSKKLSTLNTQDARKLADYLRTLERVARAEISERTAFFPAEKRYSADFLYANIGEIIGKTTYERLSDNARRDIESAGKLILLEQPTASAFHIMRACECTLKQLYKSVVKRGRKDPAMWANMVQHLVDKSELDEAQKGTLDIFRKGFRNPTAHPDTFYDIDQAQDMLATTAQLLNQLTSHAKYDRDSK